MDIHLYTLTKCGFYSRGEEEPEFGSIEEWWQQFAEWVAAEEDVSLTATFDRPEEVPRRVYCRCPQRQSPHPRPLWRLIFGGHLK
jgi:hypothetical protein